MSIEIALLFQIYSVEEKNVAETGDAEVGSDVTVGKGGNLQEIIVSVETGKYPSMGTRGSTQIPRTQETFGSQNFSQTFSQHTLQQKRR